MSILVNGSLTDEFQCSPGLRQGDPLSLLLFLLIFEMEALTSMMTKASSIVIFHGITLPNNRPKISHLLFADDILFVRQWSLSNIKKFSRIIRCFYVVTCLRMNVGKSCVYGVGVDEVQIAVMAEILVWEWR